jgi:large subunit ribosomal protein L10
MVSQKKVQAVKEVSEQLKQHPVIGVLDMFKLPARQLHQIRNRLRGKAMIRMVKKRLIALALKESGLRGAESLGEKLQGEPALIMTDMNPFKLAHLISESKSEAPAREGDIAPRDIVVRAGPTPLPPGPVIGELQKARIPAMIEGDKIHIREDTTIAREGDVIDAPLAGVMAKLGVMPMEVGLNLLAAWEKGEIYDREILFIPQEAYVNDLVAAHQRAFSLSLNTGWPARETLPLLLGRAHQEARSLAMAAGILTSETVKPLLARAKAQADALKAAAKPVEEAGPEPEGKEAPGQESEEKAKSEPEEREETEPKEAGEEKPKADEKKKPKEEPPEEKPGKKEKK